jgi:hypothetical protein
VGESRRIYQATPLYPAQRVPPCVTCEKRLARTAMATLLSAEDAAALGARPHSVHIGVEAAMSGVTRFLEQPRPGWSFSKEEVHPASAPAALSLEHKKYRAEQTPGLTAEFCVGGGIYLSHVACVVLPASQVLLTDKSSGADFAAAGHSHLLSAHPHKVEDACVQHSDRFSLSLLSTPSSTHALVSLRAGSYDVLAVVNGYAGVAWPPAWPPVRLEPRLWLMRRRGWAEEP